MPRISMTLPAARRPPASFRGATTLKATCSSITVFLRLGEYLLLFLNLIIMNYKTCPGKDARKFSLICRHVNTGHSSIYIQIQPLNVYLYIGTTCFLCLFKEKAREGQLWQRDKWYLKTEKILRLLSHTCVFCVCMYVRVKKKKRITIWEVPTYLVSPGGPISP